MLRLFYSKCSCENACRLLIYCMKTAWDCLKTARRELEDMSQANFQMCLENCQALVPSPVVLEPNPNQSKIGTGVTLKSHGPPTQQGRSCHVDNTNRDEASFWEQTVISKDDVSTRAAVTPTAVFSHRKIYQWNSSSDNFEHGKNSVM